MDQIQPIVRSLQAFYERHPRSVIAATLAGLSTPWFVNNYRKFLALGEGGVPYNVLGWGIAMVFLPLGRETTSTLEYVNDADKATWLDHSAIPERRGSRPVTGWHFLPHRQLDRIPSPFVSKRLDEIFQQHAIANPSLIELATSPHERCGKGMLIHHDIPPPHGPARQALREVAHIHASDHSLHAVLSPQDCKLVIDLGWGERHPISGVSSLIPLPKEYLMIYAPRDEEELQVVERILVAAIGYMTNSTTVA